MRKVSAQRIYCASENQKIVGGRGQIDRLSNELVTEYVAEVTQILNSDQTRSESQSAPESLEVQVVRQPYIFRTKLDVPRTGVLIVGIGGNNGTTLAAGLIANRLKLKWETERGINESNWLGSMAMMGTVKLGERLDASSVYVPIRSLLPMLNPDDICIGGWDISSVTMADAMQRSKVLPLALQKQVAPHMSSIRIFPAAFDRDFVASNQTIRADHCIKGDKQSQLDSIRSNIREFKETNHLQNVIVFWSANTERFSTHSDGVHDTPEHLLHAIQMNHSEISPSLIYATAACLEKCSFINGAPQNTFCDALVQMALKEGTFLAGDDLKTGQTKFKSVMADFLISTALKPTSMVSYNHLGNNDGLNLSSANQFKSKELSKASVVDDMVNSNSLLYKTESDKEKLDHLIVIKYVPSVGDSKRALDEYTAKIFMNGQQTFVVHNTCEDSLLAVPIMLDLILFTELLSRISVYSCADKENNSRSHLHALLSLVSLFLKAPQVPSYAPVINGLFQQKEALANFIKVAAGFTPTDYIAMSQRLTGTE